LHMFGACLLWLAALYVLALVEPRASGSDPHGAVRTTG